MNRTSTGQPITYESISDQPPRAAERQVSMRWVRSWSAPKAAALSSVSPSRTAQRLYGVVKVRSNDASITVSLSASPPARRVSTSSAGPTGIFCHSSHTASPTAPM
jgi:hypothetical protein